MYYFTASRQKWSSMLQSVLICNNNNIVCIGVKDDNWVSGILIVLFVVTFVDYFLTISTILAMKRPIKCKCDKYQLKQRSSKQAKVIMYFPRSHKTLSVIIFTVLKFMIDRFDSLTAELDLVSFFYVQNRKHEVT